MGPVPAGQPGSARVEAAPSDDAPGFAAKAGTKTIAVAFSGGRDSTALLHSTVRCASDLGLQVVALHVNHGLMPQADQWQRSIRARCAAWARRGLPLRLVCERLSEKPAAGESIEAWARRQRYLALRRMALAAGCHTVLLAHHSRDQAETFLLQALRGGGVAGLAGMPAAVCRDGVVWLRPWLAQPRAAIDAYITSHRLAFIDDDSNSDPRFARNRLRQQVWPGLLQAFPQAEQVLVDAAGWAAQATQNLNELAAIDLADTADAQGLVLERWLALTPARRSNSLRAWLHQRSGRPAPAALVERLLVQWPPTAGSSQDEKRGGRVWDWQGDRLSTRRGRLAFDADAASGAAPASSLASQRPTPLVIAKPGEYPAWGGLLIVTRVASQGIPLARLASIELRSRQGNEQFQAGPARPPRSLKKQFQAEYIPAWQRDGPLIFAEGQLLFVSGLGLDARAVEDDGFDLVDLRWRASGDG